MAIKVACEITYRIEKKVKNGGKKGKRSALIYSTYSRSGTFYNKLTIINSQFLASTKKSAKNIALQQGIGN